MFTKTVKLIVSPFSPNIEVVNDFIIKVDVPYSDQMVTIQINPNVAEYQEKSKENSPTVDVRQVIVTTDTSDTQKFTFDFDKNNEKELVFNKKKFLIKLLNIGKQNIQGQNFPTFEFLVTES